MLTGDYCAALSPALIFDPTTGDACLLLTQAGLGTPAAQAMVTAPGGAVTTQMRDLPKIPARFPVLAVAGNLSWTAQRFNQSQVYQGSDPVVSLSSATSPPLAAGRGSGQLTTIVITCRANNFPAPPVHSKTSGSSLWDHEPLCFHVFLPGDPALAQRVLPVLRQWQASLAPGPVTASLPVVSCPTTLGIAQPTVPLPPSRSVAVPRALAASLSLYADTQGIMQLLGPKGGTCGATYGADGSGGVTIYPPGAGASSPPAITGSETSVCFGCTIGQACPLFPAAAQAWQNGLGQACPTSAPAAEKVTPIAAGIVAFEDPPGVKGDGHPSGGPYTAYGVMTYHPSAPDGSWQETCTLPASEKDTCTAVLNTFVSWYGQR